MKEYKEFTKGTFYEKLKQCIKENYDVPIWEETEAISKELDIPRCRLVYLYNYDSGLGGGINFTNKGPFVGVREKKQRSRKVKVK